MNYLLTLLFSLTLTSLFAQNFDYLNHLNLGDIQYHDKLYDQASLEYEKAAFFNGKDSYLWMRLSLCYFEMNQKKKAVEACRKSIKVGLPFYAFNLWEKETDSLSIGHRGNDFVFDSLYKGYFQTLDTITAARFDTIRKKMIYTHNNAGLYRSRAIDSARVVEKELLSVIDASIAENKFPDESHFTYRQISYAADLLLTCVVNSEDHKVMFEKYSKILLDAVRQSKTRPGIYARFIDEYYVVRLKKGQKYGTLDWFQYPIENISYVDQYRQLIGLEPLNDVAYKRNKGLPLDYVFEEQ